MFKFKFESVFDSKEELRNEIKNLLWKIDHTWPQQFCSNQLKWIKTRIDEEVVKINKGARKQSIEITQGERNEHQESHR